MLGTTTLTDGRFVAVDIETTGCCPGTSSIIEIGASLIESGRIVDHFSSLVRPDDSVPASISQLTGITDDILADAAPIEQVMSRFSLFARDAVLVAHNHRFDMGFLDFEAERAHGTPFPRPVLDTLALARRLLPGMDRHNLRALAEHYGADTLPTHRAAADAEATAQVFLGMLPALLDAGLRTAQDVAAYSGLAREGALARKLVLATHLPDKLGIYAMRDADGRVIFIGRAKNLRTRVRAYFYYPSDHERAQLAFDTASIDVVTCTSELDALLLEGRLLDRYRPRFNRDQQRGRTSVYLRMDDRSRYPALTVVRNRPRTGHAIGPLTNQWAARTLAEAVRDHFGLRHCARRLNASSLPCQEADLGCPHPCAGSVSVDAYQLRVAQALNAFDGGSATLRVALQAKREHAAQQLRYEEAIVHRDALRALDRTMSALTVVRAAAAEFGAAIIDIQEDGAVVHLLRHGRRAARVRLRRSDVLDGEAERALLRAAERAYGDRCRPCDSSDFTPRQLRELFIIDNYRRQHTPREVPFTTTPDALAADVLIMLRRGARVPRKLHAAASGV